MNISLKITDSIQTIENNVNSAIASYINQKLSSNMPRIINEISSYIPNWIRSQPEIVSLLSKDSSSLAGYFGTNNASSAVDSIVNSVVGSLSWKFIKYDNKLSKGGLDIYIQPEDFLNLLSLPEGHTIYSGGDLHWLDWLLTKGDTILVSNYRYNPATGLGRTGLGSMVSGGSFRVPPQFSGTVTDNFVTRALNGNDKDKIFTKIIDTYLG